MPNTFDSGDTTLTGQQLSTLYDEKELEATRPLCWLCELPGGVARPMPIVLNVDGALEFFHEDCAEKFLDSMPPCGADTTSGEVS